MNNLITLPLAVIFSLNFAFSVEPTNPIEVPNFSNEDNTITNVTNSDEECNLDPIFIHDADIGVLGGAPDTGKTFVPRTKISPIQIQADMYVSGIKSAEDGKQILVFANHGKIILLPNNSNSSFGNRIEQSSNMVIQQGDVFELTYSASANKWIITNDNY